MVLLACAGTSYADYTAGVSVDSSSNILMRTNGQSGTMLSMYGNALLKSEKALLSYGVDSGIIDRYDGIQYHYHTLYASSPVLSRNTTLLSAALKADLARYGDISLLTGYNQYGAVLQLRSYITPSILLRSKVDFRQRLYRAFISEDFNEYETYVRIDRFFNSGTTLRGQLDAGIRDYINVPNAFTTTLFGLRARIARSLGRRWGMWLEIRNSTLHHSATGDDYKTQHTEQEFFASDIDRIFLDDRFKYSSFSVNFQTKYLFGPSGKVLFESSFSDKTYKGALTSTYNYLPQNGWNETEYTVLLSFGYRPGIIPDMVHPACDVYHVKVEASEAYLSYDSTGVSLRVDLY